jgi:hypothetical protein
MRTRLELHVCSVGHMASALLVIRPDELRVLADNMSSDVDVTGLIC